jgi:hypothetical protein
MKSFRQYLLESQRQYHLTIKLAFKPDTETLDAIEQALQRFQLDSITAPKSLPIKRVDKDFPGVNSPETYAIQIVLNYPTTADFVRNTIANIGLELQQVSVVSTDHAESVDIEEENIGKNTSDKPLLQTEYEKQDNKKISSENFGDAYNEKLVKNAAGSMDEIVPKNLRKTKGKTTNDLPIGTKSAISGTNKIPKVKSFAG